ncbi:MAG: class I SAM-dependent methyltransferase [Acidobacteriota bacterium]
MSNPNDSLLPYYERRAPEYEAIYRKPERQDDLAKLAARLPARFTGRRVLEIAAGTGYWTRRLEESARLLVAVDAAFEPLILARRRMHNPALRGDAFDLPLATASFDAAFAGFWWSHLELRQRSTFLAGLHRVLEPAARVVLLDNRYVAGSSTAISDTDAAGNTYQRRRLADGSHHRVLKNFPDGDELCALVRACDGRRPRFEELDYYWLLEYELAAARGPSPEDRLPGLR